MMKMKDSTLDLQGPVVAFDVDVGERDVKLANLHKRVAAPGNQTDAAPSNKSVCTIT